MKLFAAGRWPLYPRALDKCSHVRHSIFYVHKVPIPVPLPCRKPATLLTRGTQRNSAEPTREQIAVASTSVSSMPLCTWELHRRSKR